VDCTSPFYKFRLLVALASAWSLTWYQSPEFWVRVLVFAIYCKKLLLPPFVFTCWLSLLLFVSTCWLSLLLSVSTCWLSLLSSHMNEGVEVYKWIILALSISSFCAATIDYNCWDEKQGRIDGDSLYLQSSRAHHRKSLIHQMQSLLLWEGSALMPVGWDMQRGS
jgi:hypothetical protein